MNRTLVFFLGFLAGSVVTATTILIVVFGLNLFSGKSHYADYDDDYWVDDTIAIEVPVVEDYSVVVDDTTAIVWTEY